jgi:hypothetical protein
MGGVREGPLLNDEDDCPNRGTEACEFCKYFMETCWGGLFDDDEEEEEE